eukprot:TRINITY_DN11288_c0_g1_i2.p1 TRINITY_DN11288_c0_g1~~TRINITY_DN11288_c0_g1_i2.p1  ORF type:complete len:409 (+),score=87.27 TRINITY_DN11288_c0_g1_i2:98-1228(+)
MAKWLGDEEGTSKYVKIRQIGNGAHGDAFLVRDRAKGGKVVAKVLNMKSMSHKDVRYACSEIRCLSMLQHPNIIRYKNDVRTDRTLLIFMEYAEGGDLGRQIQGRKSVGEGFREREVSLMFAQICSAVSAIHAARMLHRDIKTANIFLTSNGIIKVGDFGYANIYTDTISNPVAGTFCGTPCYLAPELWEMDLYNKQAEIWSMGIVLYELLALKKPFYSSNMSDLRQLVMTQPHPPVPPHFSQEIKDICNAMLEKSPSKRVTLSTIMASKYIQQAFTSLLRAIKKQPHFEQQHELVETIQSHLTPKAVPETVQVDVPCALRQAVVTSTGEMTWVDCELTVQKPLVCIRSQTGTVSYNINEIVNACPISPKVCEGKQ